VEVERYGGLLDTLLDGTRVVTMTTTQVVTDQVARAARCALFLRDVLPEAPMAIATGRSEVGLRQNVGDIIERAVLLLDAACAGGAPRIALDDLTAALLDPRFEVEVASAREGGAPLESSVVRRRSSAGGSADGPRAPQPSSPDCEGVLCLRGMRPIAPGSRTLLGRATTMVGREWEVGTIETIFRNCVDEGDGRPVLVTGAAGMGKSRLVFEAVASLRRAHPGAEVWWGWGDPLRADSAFGLLGQVIRDAAGLDEGDSLEAHQRRFAERVAAWAPPGADNAWVAEVLGEIAAIPFPDEGSTVLQAARQEPHVMLELLHAAWEALVAGACAAGPLIVVLEDLQWADAATVRLIDTALASVHGPWMLLAPARPDVHEVFPHLWEGRDLQEVRLGPLTRRASERLVRQALGNKPGDETVRRLATCAEGNAFYLEELIRAVADAESDVETGSSSGLASIHSLPETVLALVQARLGGLDAETRRVLRAASVFGEVFWVGGVTALLGGSEPSPEWPELLLESELLVFRPESRFAGERELAFRNVLLREGAYAMLTEGDRMLGHALAGAWLEEKGEPDAMVLAAHFDLARDRARAASSYRTAALAALRVADMDACIARAERAITLSPAEDVHIECSSLLCEGYAWRDEHGRALASADDVIARAAPGSTPWLRAMMTKQRATMMLGRIDDLRATVATLCAVDAAPGTEGAFAFALLGSAFHLFFDARFAAASPILDRLVALASASSDPMALTMLETARSWLAGWARGDAWSALQHARRAVYHAEGARDARQRPIAQLHVAIFEWALGMVQEAEADLRALPSGASPSITSTAERYLTLILIERGALDEARSIAQRRTEEAHAKGGSDSALREAEGRWLLGEIAARSGDLAAAEREITAVADLLHRSAALLWQLAAARLVEVRLARGDVHGGLALAREVAGALAASGGHGLRGTLVRLVHAEALHAAGEVAAAHAVLREAQGDLQARAALVDDHDARARFLEAVPENARVLLRAQEWLAPRGD
jgi:hypothetical protein